MKGISQEILFPHKSEEVQVNLNQLKGKLMEIAQK
jgi:hypothetical protein